jgi:hypothetical protein
MLVALDEEKLYLPFWLGVFLLGLAAVSGLLHISGRTARRSQPFSFARAGPAKPPASGTPVVVRPVEE